MPQTLLVSDSVLLDEQRLPSKCRGSLNGVPFKLNANMAVTCSAWLDFALIHSRALYPKSGRWGVGGVTTSRTQAIPMKAKDLIEILAVEPDAEVTILTGPRDPSCSIQSHSYGESLQGDKYVYLRLFELQAPTEGQAGEHVKIGEIKIGESATASL